MSTIPGSVANSVIPEKEIVPVHSPDFDHPETSVPTGLVPAGLVMLLGFFLASSPARNSDFWLHLATGKALLQGQYQFGVEPFSGGASSYWVNPSWLFDLLLYFIYQSLGGSVLIVLKGLVVGATAGLLVLRGGARKSFFLSSLCAGLTLVAIGPWLALKPVCLSFFFLAWTIYYLERKLDSGREHFSLVSFWPLLAIFALWANLDAWFFLGPLTLGCFFLGSLLPAQGGKANSSVLGVLTLAGLGACLVNPHHVQIFSVPYELMFSGAASQLEQDIFLRLLTAPFQNIYFSALFFNTIPGFVFWLLTGGTLLSFIMDYGGWPWRWFLIWTLLLLLSFYQVLAIPFLAIVSAPILARNIGHYFARQQTGVFRERFLRPGRALAFLAVSAMVIAAWPGWLSLGPAGPRAWRVELDPGFRTVGAQLAQWREQGKIPGKTLAFSPETGNFLAWYCPDISCPVNSHLHLSKQEAADLLAARDGLMGTKSPGFPEGDWRAILRAGQVGLLIIHGDDQPSIAAMKNLSPAYRETPLLCLQGKTAVFGWRDPLGKGKDLYAGMARDLQTEAFADKAVAEPTLPARDPVMLRWWDAFWRPRITPSVDRDEAKTLLALFDGNLPKQREKLIAQGQAKCVAELVYSVLVPGPANSNCCLLANINRNPVMMNRLLNAFVQDQDEGSLSTLYLAVRACRRALQANPDDAQTWFLLGETYARLREFTRERSWGSVLGNFRTCQELACYRQALDLNRRNWRIHQRMADIFAGMVDYKDLTLKHLKEIYKIRSAGREPGEAREVYRDRMQKLKSVIEALDNEMQSLLDRFAANSANLRVVDRANMAGQYGLSGTALDILLKSDIAAFGAKGLEIELKLLLNSGQVNKVKSWLDPDHRRLLGDLHYLLISAQLEAGLGNYARAQSALQEMLLGQVGEKKLHPINLVALELGNIVLYESAGGPLKFFPIANLNVRASKDSLSKNIASNLGLMNQEAVSLVLQGTLAVEAGDNKKASACFRQALAFWNSTAGIAFQDDRSQTGRRMAQFFLRQMEKANR